MTRDYVDDRDRITLNVTVAPSGCWEWNRCLNSDGYSRISVRGTVHYGHRFSYETFVGPIPDGLHIDHLCRNRGCVNPEHLEPVTCAMNLRRAPDAVPTINAAKRECLNGHEFTPENTWVRSDGRRHCRACNRARARATYARRKAA